MVRDLGAGMVVVNYPDNGFSLNFLLWIRIRRGDPRSLPWYVWLAESCPNNNRGGG